MTKDVKDARMMKETPTTLAQRRVRDTRTRRPNLYTLRCAIALSAAHTIRSALGSGSPDGRCDLRGLTVTALGDRKCGHSALA